MGIDRWSFTGSHCFRQCTALLYLKQPFNGPFTVKSVQKRTKSNRLENAGRLNDRFEWVVLWQVSLQRSVQWRCGQGKQILLYPEACRESHTCLNERVLIPNEAQIRLPPQSWQKVKHKVVVDQDHLFHSFN